MKNYKIAYYKVLYIDIYREKQQQEKRMMLKGVRTNRRFELQMKCRNLNA
jgi:phosphopantetheine adenylyltransferase